jgi:PDZ domain
VQTMVETIVEVCEEGRTSPKIPVIFIEDRDIEEVNEQLINDIDHYSPSVRLLNISKQSTDVGFGFLLSRSKWDPYPYISRIDVDSAASIFGLKEGDCVLEVNNIKKLSFTQLNLKKI